MLLPNFTDKERLWEVVRSADLLYNTATEYFDAVLDVLGCRKHFPTFERFSFKDDKHNDWYMTYYISSKRYAKSERMACMAYLVYEIPMRMCKNPSNAGKGILLCNPIGLNSKELRLGTRVTAVMDFTPHMINRYTERYLIPNGFTNLDIHKKIEKIMTRYEHFDVISDESAQKQCDRKGGVCNYDIILKEGGMIRGIFTNNLYLKFFTYISPKMMFKEQTERVAEMMREKHRWIKEGKY